MSIQKLIDQLSAYLAQYPTKNAGAGTGPFSTPTSSTPMVDWEQLCAQIYTMYIQCPHQFPSCLTQTFSKTALKEIGITINPTALSRHTGHTQIAFYQPGHAPANQNSLDTIYHLGVESLTVKQGVAIVHGHRAQVIAESDTLILAYGQTHVQSAPDTEVWLYEQSSCQAYGGTVHAYDHAYVTEQGPCVVELCGHSNGYFPLGKSQLNASDNALFYAVVAPEAPSPCTLCLKGQALGLIERKGDAPYKLWIHDQAALHDVSESRCVQKEQWLTYLKARHQAPVLKPGEVRQMRIGQLILKTGRYLKNPEFQRKAQKAQSASELLEILLPYLPEALRHNVLPIDFLRQHFDQATLEAHQIYAYDQPLRGSHLHNPSQKPVFLLGTFVQVLTTADTPYYAYEQTLLIVKKKGNATVQGQALGIVTGQATLTAAGQATAYAVDQAHLTLEDYARGIVSDHSHCTAKQQSQVTADQHARVTLREESAAFASDDVYLVAKDLSRALITKSVSVHATGESIVAISESSGPLPAYVKMSQKGVILQLHSKPQIDVFKEKFIDEKPKDMIKAFNEMADRERIRQKSRKK